MRAFGSTALALAASLSTAAAQLVYNNTQINVQSTNQYSGASLAGYHIGAALSYIVAQSPGAGSSFSFNLSATSDQLLDNDIAADYQLPCYVVSTPQISNNSGPLECGAGDQDGYYDIAQVTAPYDTSPGTVTFVGITEWYVCAVQSFSYGWVQGTIVGAIGSDAPSGAGIQNCTAIDALAFTGAGNSSTTTAPTSTDTSVSASGSDPASNVATAMGSTPASLSSTAGPASSSSSVATTALTVDPVLTNPTSGSASYLPTMVTVTLPCSSRSASANATYSAGSQSSNPIASYTGTFVPVATWTGAAGKAETSALIGLVFAIAALLL